jgi:hypothetical protein
VIGAIGRKYIPILALGWAGHAAWDFFLHPAVYDYFPSWYPGGCAGFDLFLAAYIFANGLSSIK